VAEPPEPVPPIQAIGLYAAGYQAVVTAVREYYLAGGEQSASPEIIRRFEDVVTTSLALAQDWASRHGSGAGGRGGYDREGRWGGVVPAPLRDEVADRWWRCGAALLTADDTARQRIFYDATLNSLNPEFFADQTELWAQLVILTAVEISALPPERVRLRLFALTSHDFPPAQVIQPPY